VVRHFTKYRTHTINPILLQWGFLCCFFGVLLPGYAQKRMEKNWDASAFQALEINTHDVSKISIKTSATETISLTAIIAGEYSENVVLEVSESNNVLVLGTGFRPFFTPKNDKLAAHKVLSIEFQLLLPQTLSLKVISSLSSLEITGKLKQLKAKLEAGQIQLYKFEGNAKLTTHTGDIICEVSKATTGEGMSKEGFVESTLKEAGTFQVRATTVKGNIRLYHSKE